MCRQCLWRINIVLTAIQVALAKDLTQASNKHKGTSKQASKEKTETGDSEANEDKSTKPKKLHVSDKILGTVRIM